MPEIIPTNVSIASDDSAALAPKKLHLEEPPCEVRKALTTEQFRPENMHLVSVLRNDLRVKSIVLHTKFEDSPDKDAIVILEKSPFSSDPDALKTGGVVRTIQEKQDASPSESEFATRTWKADHLMSNDVYHRLLVSKGFEAVSDVNMTVIHPADEHHFKRFTSGGRRVIQESPALYKDVIVPFLAQKPRDLSWVENILSGTSEADRVVYSDHDPQLGFVLVQDYRWDGKDIVELHYLAIARDPTLTCLRDLRSVHVPMLKQIVLKGSEHICEKHPSMEPDQLLAYLHYPPTFYWLHVHFVHADSDDQTLRAGRAHLLDEVIRNMELDESYYAQRTMTVCLHENSPMLDAIHDATTSIDGSSQSCEKDLSVE